MFGREHIFSELLYDAHEKAGLTDNGCYCFKKLSWYGNIVSYEPTVEAVKAFLAHGFVRAELEELERWYKSINATLDQVCLSSYLRSILASSDMQPFLDEADKVRAEEEAAEEARLAAIPHTHPPEDALPYKHSECIEDFAGNHSQPGAWADVFVNESGQELVAFGGCWKHYCDGDGLDRFMDGERGCPVEARPAKVKRLKKITADPDNSFGGIIAFLEKEHAGLRFGEEFKWDGDD